MKELFSLIAIILLCGACNRPDPNPEKLDPIYGDLLVEASNAQKEVVLIEKDLETARADIATATPQTGQSKGRWAAYYDIEKKLEKARQNVRFLELSAERRKQIARKSYLEAFNKGESWPQPGEYEAYMTNKRLVTAPKNWNVRLKAELADQAAKAAKPQAKPAH